MTWTIWTHPTHRSLPEVQPKAELTETSKGRDIQRAIRQIRDTRRLFELVLGSRSGFAFLRLLRLLVLLQLLESSSVCKQTAHPLRTPHVRPGGLG